jgi:hypothetical protein
MMIVALHLSTTDGVREMAVGIDDIVHRELSGRLASVETGWRSIALLALDVGRQEVRR